VSVSWYTSCEAMFDALRLSLLRTLSIHAKRHHNASVLQHSRSTATQPQDASSDSTTNTTNTTATDADVGDYEMLVVYPETIGTWIALAGIGNADQYTSLSQVIRALIIRRPLSFVYHLIRSICGLDRDALNDQSAASIARGIEGHVQRAVFRMVAPQVAQQ
jgi:hypothetical protein